MISEEEVVTKTNNAPTLNRAQLLKSTLHLHLEVELELKLDDHLA